MQVQPVTPPPPPPPRDHAAAARAFEALVAAQLVGTMLDGAGLEAMMGEGPAQLWQGHLADALGRQLAPGLGLAPRIEAELRRADGEK